MDNECAECGSDDECSGCKVCRDEKCVDPYPCPEESCAPHSWSAAFMGCPESFSGCIPGATFGAVDPYIYYGSVEYPCGGTATASWVCDPCKECSDSDRWRPGSFSTSCFTGVSVVAGSILSPGSCDSPPMWEFTATGLGDCGCCEGGEVIVTPPVECNCPRNDIAPGLIDALPQPDGDEFTSHSAISCCDAHKLAGNTNCNCGGSCDYMWIESKGKWVLDEDFCNTSEVVDY